MGKEQRKIYLYLEDGTLFEGESFGAGGTVSGEVVFNTSITGYQEIATDPSYAGQFVLFTQPEIGIVGVNAQDMESINAHCAGVIVRNANSAYSNFRGEESFAQFLEKEGVVAISGIDTRALTKHIREHGAMMAVASTELETKEALQKALGESKRIEEINYINTVSAKTRYWHEKKRFDFVQMDYAPLKSPKFKVAAIDFGIKLGILNELGEAGIASLVIPAAEFDPKEIISLYEQKEIDGVFLSNGPGDPLVLKEEAAKIKELVAADIPIFGICLGHQLLSIANGYLTKKLKFGHHGGNHPVKSCSNNSVYITSQNHNYGVTDAIKEVADVLYVNLFDDSIEGVRYRDKKIFSLQHHPEASPGPNESKEIFAAFCSILER